LPVKFPLKNSDDVFQYYVDKFGLDGDGDIHAIALFTYALVESARIDFIKYSVETLKRTPTPQDIEDWYAEKPPTYFDDLSDRGLTWYSGFARYLLEDEFEEHAKAAVNNTIGTHFDNISSKLDTIPNAVRTETRPLSEHLKWSRHFWIGFWAGVASNVIFTVLVVIFVFVIDRDFSFIGWAKGLMNTPTSVTSPTTNSSKP
jgi:hypothetical protein